MISIKRLSSGSAGVGALLPALLLFASAWGCGGIEEGTSPMAPEMPNALPQAGESAALAPLVLGAMNDSIQGEYYALFTYTKVLTDFGVVQPFSSIRGAEARHVESVGRLFVARGLEIPVSNWDESNVPAYTRLVEACAAGREIELANVAIYEGFLSLELPADVGNVFLHLLLASRDQHLPAFERCLDRSG